MATALAMNTTQRHTFAALIISYMIFIVSLNSQATALSCESLFLKKQSQNESALVITESKQHTPIGVIAGAQKIRTKIKTLLGAITFSTQSIVENFSKINLPEYLKNQLLAGLNKDGPLGYGGVLGPASAGNRWGPVGNTSLNPSTYISGFDWSQFAKFFNSHGGALDKFGVYSTISVNSKLGQSMLHTIPNHQLLIAGAPMMMVGPDGIVGTRSLISALGPIGAHGFKRLSDGSYVHIKKVESEQIEQTEKTEVTAEEESGQIQEKLFELYTVEKAKELSDNNKLGDRFAIDGKINEDEVLDFNYNAKANEWIVFAVEPGGAGDSFSIEILDTQGNTLSESKLKYLINSSTWHFEHDTQVVIRVKNEGKSPYYNPLIEFWNRTYQNALAANPYLKAFQDKLPPNILTQTLMFRLHVVSNPSNKDNLQIVPGAHWSQFFR